jgi:hypothetical protein
MEIENNSTPLSLRVSKALIINLICLFSNL